MWPVRRKWPLLEGTYRKVDLLYRWSVRHTILLGRVCDPLLGGGTYIPDYTVVAPNCQACRVIHRPFLCRTYHESDD
jgi:hypothetical protein